MNYDAVIVGASIAGLSTGMLLAKTGWKVCIVDRRREIGVPVRCGEATGNRGELARFVDIDESWIAGDIDGLSLHVNGSLIRRHAIRNGGVMLHRDRFEKHLAEKAIAYGATLMLDTPVRGLSTNGNKWDGITLENRERVRADFIIGADGCECYVGRWAGIMRSLFLHEVASTVQYRLTSDFCDDGYLQFFIGASTIPNGYIWVFPKSNNSILVGGGMYYCSPRLPKVRHFVDRFIAERFADAPPYADSMITGAIPVSISPRKLTKENIILVGDAARQVNPLSGGGIMNTLEAADSAVRYLTSLRRWASVSVPDTYSREWARNQRFQNKLYALAREVWFSIPDAKLHHFMLVAGSFLKKDPDRSKLFQVPLIPFIRFLFNVFPLTIRHIGILFK